MSFDTPGLAMQEATKWKTGNRLPSMTRDDTVASSDPRYALPGDAVLFNEAASRPS